MKICQHCTIKMAVLLICCLLITLSSEFSLSSEVSSGICLRAKPWYSFSAVPCSRCTQVSFTPDFDIIVSPGDNNIYIKNEAQQSFRKIPISFRNQHAIIHLPANNVYYICDTDNNRILVVDSLESGQIAREITKIAGVRLHRPHDILYDKTTGYIYAITSLAPKIFKFNHSGRFEKMLDLSSVLEYSRAISLIGGTLYVAGSRQGKVLKITDFDNGQYQTFQSFGKKNSTYSGSWSDDGLIINDIERYHGYWYVTSYFCPSSSSYGTDYNQNKLIRFKEWSDFETGSWQDLSHLIPDGIVPYFMTVADDSLGIAAFSHETIGQKGTVYRISTSCMPQTAVLNLLLD